MLLHATDVLGLPKEAMADYLKDIEGIGAEIPAEEILQRVRDKQSLVDIINEANRQLQQGSLEPGLLGAVLDSSSTGRLKLEAVADTIKAGFPNPPRGVPLRTLPTITKLSGGIVGMWVMGGVPAVGKSALAWQIGIDASRELPVLFYDCENTQAVLLKRTKEMFGGSVEKARAALGRVYIRDSVRSLDSDLAAFGSNSPCLVIVDSIQKLPASIEYRRSSIDRWIHRLEFLKKKGHYVLIISEVGRASYGNDPSIGAYKETGEIEYSGDLCLLLQDGPSRGLTEIHIVKNRHEEYVGVATIVKRINNWVFRELDSPVGETELGT